MNIVDVIVRGSGSGREQAIRAIQASGIEVKSIMDDTPCRTTAAAPRRSSAPNAHARPPAPPPPSHVT